MRTLLTVALVFALALPVLAETPRHTPNFPTNTTSADLTNLLKVLEDPEVASLIWKLANMSSDSSEVIAELIEKGAISRDEGARILRALNTSLNELSGGVDPSLLSSVEKLLASSRTDPEELKELVKTLVALRESGLLSPHNFITLAKVLAEAFKDLNLEIPAELTYGVLRSLNELVNPSASTQEAEWVGASASAITLWEFPSLRISFPSIQGVSLPGGSMWVTILLPLSLALVLGLTYRRKLCAYLAKLKTAISSAVERKAVPEDSDVVSIYWASVRLVERISGVRKLDYLTHREYSGSVARALEGAGRSSKLAEYFGEITKLYEVSRFSHEADASVVVKAREKFAELVKTVG